MKLPSRSLSNQKAKRNILAAWTAHVQDHPEDIGGVWGYEEYLEAIADPKHERHDEFMEWNGGWDSEKFSVEAINKGADRGFSWR